MRSVTTLKMLVLLTCLSTGGAALADPGNGQGRGHNKGGYYSARSESVVIVNDNDRGAIRSFLREKNCPPGLAKKDVPCVPPGQVKHQYNVGDVLVVDQPRSIWHALADIISPPPAGHRYVRTDTDVLLVTEGSNRIVDIIRAD
jgi:hypothetical protein